MRRIRSIAGLATLVPMLALAGSLEPASAQPIPPSPRHELIADWSAARLASVSFRVATSQHYGQPDNASGYSVILAAGRNRAWAFGGTNPGGASVPVAELWNGRTITRWMLPAGLTGFINDASAPAPSDAWVASEFGRYVLHWDGTRWSLARRFDGVITGVTAVSSNDVWVFGTTTAEGLPGSGTWHFTGRHWTRLDGSAGSVYRASAVSERSIWAISPGSRRAQVLRYNGRSWRPVRTGRALDGLRLRDILAISNRDVWILGYRNRDGSVRPALAHWNGVTWSRLTTQLSAWPGRLARGRDGVVFVTAVSAGKSATGLILSATAAGWGKPMTIRSALGSGVSDVTLSTSGRSLWAAGGILTRLGGDAVLWEGSLARTARHLRDIDDDDS